MQLMLRLGIIGVTVGGLFWACGGNIATDDISGSSGMSSTSTSIGSTDNFATSTGTAVASATFVNTTSSLATAYATSSDIGFNTASSVGAFTATITFGGMSTSSMSMITTALHTSTAPGTFTFIRTGSQTFTASNTSIRTATVTSQCSFSTTSVCTSTITVPATDVQTNTDTFVQIDAGTDPADAGLDPTDAGPDPADAGPDPADAGASLCASLNSGRLPAASTITQLTIAPHCGPDSSSPILLVDATRAQAVYHLTTDLSFVEPGIYHCGADSGLTYDLVFLANGRPLKSSIKLSGCLFVTIDGESCDRFGSLLYFLQLVQTLGAPASNANIGTTNDFLNLSGSCGKLNHGDAGVADAG